MAKPPTHAPVSASASKTTVDKQGTGELRCISIEVAQNGGFTVRPEYYSKPSKGNMCGPYEPAKEYVFADRPALYGFLDTLIDAPK